MAGLTKEQKAAKALLEKAVELSGLTAEDFALLTDEERAEHAAKAQEAIDAAAAAKAQEDEIDNSHLIEVTKDGVTLAVHPTTLAAHKNLGWRE